tara:strand:+ start:1598 stop:1978 length:381 start_codon:yes stop_codon:yes gene_type:complete
MAHFAELDENNIVKRVLALSNDVITKDGEEIESKGVFFLRNLFGEGTKWKKTSYNNNFRGRFAGKDFVYDSDLDVFYPQKPFDSWTLNTNNYDWEAPIPYPDDENIYTWNEEAYQSDNTTGWEVRE